MVPWSDRGGGELNLDLILFGLGGAPGTPWGAPGNPGEASLVPLGSSWDPWGAPGNPGEDSLGWELNLDLIIFDWVKKMNLDLILSGSLVGPGGWNKF